jgi:phosphoribosylanthranilate isomerase
MSVRIKICGITRERDAVLAAALGAEAIGLVFWPGSPRAISVDVARDIVAAVPSPMVKVGVFVNQPLDEVRAVAEAVGLDGLQFHGDEADEDVAALTLAVLKAVPLGQPGAEQRALNLPAGVVPLLDVFDPVRRGGTGQTTDWDVAARIAAKRPTMLSGGLTPENVGEAIRKVDPWYVDVSSGVEASPGVKDEGKLRRFVEAVRAARA